MITSKIAQSILIGVLTVGTVASTAFASGHIWKNLQLDKSGSDNLQNGIQIEAFQGEDSQDDSDTLENTIADNDILEMNNQSTPTSSNPTPTVQITPTVQPTPTTNPTFPSASTPTATPTVTPTNTNNANTCIVTLFGQQYDVQSLRSTHSGGDIFQCGTDMSSVYQSQHGTNLSRMQKYLVTNTNGNGTSTGSNGTNIGNNSNGTNTNNSNNSNSTVVNEDHHEWEEDEEENEDDKERYVEQEKHEREDSDHDQEEHQADD